MAAGSPVSQANGRATATRAGTVLKAATVAAPTATATSGSLPTADGAVTIADATTPTVVELLEYCTELRAKQAALITSLQAAGVLT
jgi:hypothetical protein